MPVPIVSFFPLTRTFKLAMLYLLAVIFPPLAVLLCGKPVQAMLNLVLTVCLWLPGLIHAIFVVNESKANKRNRDLINAMKHR